MFTTAQLSKLSPVIATAWERHCDQNDLDPHRKASNNYRGWYEAILTDAVGATSTKELSGAKDFGKVLLAFAVEAGDEAAILDLAEDEEHRHRWVLRMLACDLSLLRLNVVGWEYIRGIYGQSKLPPGDFSDCPAEMLAKVIQMLDTQIRRECKRRGIAPIQIPRRAENACRGARESKKVEIMSACGEAVAALADARGTSPDELLLWYNGLCREAQIDLAKQRHADSFQEVECSSTNDSSSSECPF